MRHDEAEDMGFGMRKERSEPVMVNTSPPATQRDRWMYEQGRLAERDPRTHADIAWELAEKVRRDLDRQSCPDVFMRIVVESIVKNFTTQPAAQPAPVKPVAWINAEKRTFEWNGPVLWNTPTVAVLDKIPLYTTPPTAQRQLVGLTDESVVSAAARVLSDRVAASCNVDCGDMWMLHGNDSIEDARAMLEAAKAKLKETT